MIESKILGFGTLVTVILFYTVLPSTSFAQEQVPQEQVPQEKVTINNKHLLNDDDVSSLPGWNPDGLRSNFLIEDETVDWTKSIVIVNVHTIGLSICNVDTLDVGFFSIFCSNPPDNGSELHYMVINGEPSTELMQNQTRVETNYTNIS